MKCLKLTSSQLTDYARHHAIEQRRFFRNGIDNNDHTEAYQAPKLRSRTLLDGFSQLVNEQEAAPERTDIRQLGRFVRVVPDFVAKLHPGSFLEIFYEFDFVHLAFGARSALRAHVRGFQFLDMDLAGAKRILDGEGLGEIQ